MTNIQLFITVLLTTLGLAFLATGLAIWIESLVNRRLTAAESAYRWHKVVKEIAQAKSKYQDYAEVKDE